ncbi:hypothetical protein HDE78_000003 [Rhodanobacter sp. K2T2]|uniref:XAC0095 family protein n=1 Tax=Rhodanobacter sp. K2T2 TaxID=2723085 RepID=UPI0015CA416F|nr:hypothetical protein [Rhodanobacter sp. K2T2]NYE27078.1 hypothetical protein [Rhodanobacter sp. K2T2]
MSTFDANDRETRGYFLPENSQLRLQKLRDYAEFLSHIAQPRTPDAEHEGIPEINAEQVAICLEFLAEQLGFVLDNLSFPAYRSEREAEQGAYAKPEAAEAMPYDTGERYRFGITLDQVDTLNQLIDMIVAHGDVVTASHDTELADHTLSLLGHAIFNDARAVRDIIRQVESQQLNPTRSSHTHVSEEQGVYEVVQKTSRVRWITNAKTDSDIVPERDSVRVMSGKALRNIGVCHRRNST